MSAKEAILEVSDPAISKFNPLRHFGAISEKMEASLRQFLKKDSLSKIEGKNAPKRKFPIVEPEVFKSMYYMKYLKSVAHPGENVGTIAA